MADHVRVDDVVRTYEEALANTYAEVQGVLS